ncbi:MAG TPA: lysylphosphatidylglycerol synthase domain-containing protein [Hyphomonadaceae bacterium]|nr:lysylphosphatidylglycerol synthase domain-containing protein [Hyphomonadaceae bacterium]
MRKQLVLAAKIAAAVLFTALAIQVLVNEFAATSIGDVADGLAHIGWVELGLAATATLVVYSVVATYDGLALHYAGRKLSFARSAMSSTTTYAISNLLGFPVFTGNALRLWLYGHWGLGASEVVIAALVTTIVCNIALALLAGVSLVISTDEFVNILGLSPALIDIVGALLIAGAAALIAIGIAGPRKFSLWKLDYVRPGPLLVPHVFICAIDYSATSAVLYVLLNDTLSIDFIHFIALFSVAKTIGIFSNIPGGLGIFEAVMASTMRSVAPADLAAALIAYRCIFYLAPFLVAAAFVAVHGLRRASRSQSARRNPPRQPSHPSAQKRE